MSSYNRARKTLGLATPLVLASLFAATPAHALYKIVGPDGKVTYTDQPPVNVENKVQPMDSRGNINNDVALPYELRQVAQRYPVTLYVSSDCQPCDAGRQMLRERGIPLRKGWLPTTTTTRRCKASPAPPACPRSLSARRWCAVGNAASGIPISMPRAIQRNRSCPPTSRKARPSR